METVPYRFIDHTADIGIEVSGRTVQELFSNALRGFTDLLTEVTAVRGIEERHITVKAEDQNELLIAWLSELLYFYDTEQKLFSESSIHKLTETELTATVKGEVRDPQRHPIRREVKAVTYHNIRIRQEEGRWKATIIFDI